MIIFSIPKKHMKQKILSLGWVICVCLGGVACAQPSPVPNNAAPSDKAAQVFLDDLLQLAISTEPGINLPALSKLAQTDMAKKIRDNQNAAPSTGADAAGKNLAASAFHVMPIGANSMGAGIVSISYQKRFIPKPDTSYTSAPRQPLAVRYTKFESVVIALNASGLCVNKDMIAATWSERFKDQSLSPLGTGYPVTLNPHRQLDTAQQPKQPSAGPYSLFTNLRSSYGGDQQVTFTFTHEYQPCARSIILEHKYI
jgi:hypothetical protein